MKPRPQGNALFVILGQNNLEHTFENLTKLLKILEGNNQLFFFSLSPQEFHLSFISNCFKNSDNAQIPQGFKSVSTSCLLS
jgi:hypothetical protein